MKAVLLTIFFLASIAFGYLTPVTPPSGVTSVTGTSPIVSSGGATPAISIFTASGSQAGALSSSDWTTFNGKQATLTLGNLTTPTTGVSIGSGTGAVVGSGTTVSVQTASGSQPGLLSAADWTTFNGKQASGNYITVLTSDVSATGPGSVAATVNSVGGSTAANIHSAELLANAATNVSTASTIVKRDASSNFNTNSISFSGQLTGTSGATASAPPYSFNVSGGTNSGMYYVNAGQVFIAAAGTGILKVTGAGSQVAVRNVLNFNLGGTANSTNTILGGSTSDKFDISGDSAVAHGGEIILGSRSAAIGEVIQFQTAGTLSGSVSNAQAWTLGASGGTQTHTVNGALSVSKNVTSSGVFIAPTGTVGAPTYTFAGNTTTGLYSSAANEVSIVANGSQVLRVDSGSVGLPIFMFMNQAGTAGQTDVFATGSTSDILDITGDTVAANGGEILLFSRSSASPHFTQFKNAGTISGSINATQTWTIGASGGTNTHTVNGTLQTTVDEIIGGKLNITEGVNASMGLSTLVGGTVTVSNTRVTANSRIFLTIQNPGGVPGAVYVSSRSAGTNFIITSTSAADTSDVAWVFIEPH